MKAIVSVIGKDCKGLIAKVSALLYENGINIVDISQTVMREFFTMIMLVELDGADIAPVAKKLADLGKKLAVEIRIQHEDIFNAMHRI